MGKMIRYSVFPDYSYYSTLLYTYNYKVAPIMGIERKVLGKPRSSNLVVNIGKFMQDYWPRLFLERETARIRGGAIAHAYVGSKLL